MFFPSIVTLKGGLGNQLFQYAFGKWLEKEHNQKVYFDARGLSNAISPRQFELYFFRLFEYDQDKFIFQSKGLPKIFPKIAATYYSRTSQIISEASFDFSDPKPASYFGFWQRNLFVNSIINFNPSLFRFKPEIVQNWPAIISSDVESVGIHVRGTDYLNHPSLVNLSKAYFEKAISLLSESLQNPSFYVFTDDPTYSKEVLSGLSYNIVSTKSGIQDFYHLSQCKHQIISNSTFSWWAATINNNPGKLVVSPVKWFKNQGHQLENKKWINI